MTDIEKIILALRRAIAHGTTPELAGLLAELEKITHKKP